MLTNHTCSEACWFAREETCHCSCGGKNHGIMRSGKAERPQRTCLIRGKRYRLEAISDFLGARTLAGEIWEAAWKANIYGIVEDRQATDSQQKWPEIKAWMDAHDDEIPRLVWVAESYRPAVAA